MNTLSIFPCLFKPPKKTVQLQLESRTAFPPSIRYQIAWAKRFSPNVEFDPHLGSWKLLQRFTAPLIQELATHSHRDGCIKLELFDETAPSFGTFQTQVLRETGWEILATDCEMPASEYFTLLAQKKFPCIPQLRPVSEVLCAQKPDFWHEAIGHIAALCDAEVSHFYQRTAELYCLLHQSSPEKTLLFEKILWVVLEYGFLFEDGKPKAFGAAVSGSYVALTKWKTGQWNIRPLDLDSILSSGLFEEELEAKRDEHGRLIFFSMNSLKETLSVLERYAQT